MTFVLWVTAEEWSLCSNQQQEGGEKPGLHFRFWLKKNKRIQSIELQVFAWPHWKSSSTFVPHLRTNSSHTWTSMMNLNYPNLKFQNLNPPMQPGTSKGLLHNRNSPAGLTRQFPLFRCGQTGGETTLVFNSCWAIMPDSHSHFHHSLKAIWWWV